MAIRCVFLVMVCGLGQYTKGWIGMEDWLVWEHVSLKFTAESWATAVFKRPYSREFCRKSTGEHSSGLVYHEMQEQSGNMKESAFKTIAFFRNSTQNDPLYRERVSLMNPQKPTQEKQLECSYIQGNHPHRISTAGLQKGTLTFCFFSHQTLRQPPDK